MERRALPAEGSWSGQPAYIVGGGPSLKAFDWDLLKPKRNIIVINMAYLNVPHADVFFTEDLRVIEELIPSKEEYRRAWDAFAGAKVYHCLEQSFRDRACAVAPDLHIIERKRRDKFWSASFGDGLSLSSNSAIGALNIAAILGADPIYLLGIDCRRTGDEANYHAHYPQDWLMPQGQGREYASDFTHWAALHTKDRTVINLINPDFESALDCWPKMDWRFVLGSVPTA